MCDILVGASKTHLFLSTPCHNCTPMIPNTTKISVQIAKTLPSMGNVSKSNATKILIPVKDQINLLKGIDIVKSLPGPSQKYNILNLRTSTCVASLWSQRNNGFKGTFYGLFIAAMRYSRVHFL